jgi:hypothetical protein
MFLDLVEHLVEWVRGAPTLLLVLARPELRETREVLTAAGRRAREVVDLAPCAGRHDAREVVEHIAVLAERHPEPRPRAEVLTGQPPIP